MGTAGVSLGGKRGQRGRAWAAEASQGHPWTCVPGTWVLLRKGRVTLSVARAQGSRADGGAGDESPRRPEWCVQGQAGLAQAPRWQKWALAGRRGRDAARKQQVPGRNCGRLRRQKGLDFSPVDGTQSRKVHAASPCPDPNAWSAGLLIRETGLRGQRSWRRCSGALALVRRAASLSPACASISTAVDVRPPGRFGSQIAGDPQRVCVRLSSYHLRKLV